MLQNMIRFEILFPIHFNNGEIIPLNMKSEAISQIRRRFGAVSVEGGYILGYWTDEEEKVIVDKNCKIFVDTIAIEIYESIKWFSQMKQLWLISFKQEEIWLVFYPLTRI